MFPTGFYLPIVIDEAARSRKRTFDERSPRGPPVTVVPLTDRACKRSKSLEDTQVDILSPSQSVLIPSVADRGPARTPRQVDSWRAWGDSSASHAGGFGSFDSTVSASASASHTTLGSATTTGAVPVIVSLAGSWAGSEPSFDAPVATSLGRAKELSGSLDLDAEPAPVRRLMPAIAEHSHSRSFDDSEAPSSCAAAAPRPFAGFALRPLHRELRAAGADWDSDSDAGSSSDLDHGTGLRTRSGCESASDPLAAGSDTSEGADDGLSSSCCECALDGSAPMLVGSALSPALARMPMNKALEKLRIEDSLDRRTCVAEPRTLPAHRSHTSARSLYAESVRASASAPALGLSPILASAPKPVSALARAWGATSRSHSSSSSSSSASVAMDVRTSRAR